MFYIFLCCMRLLGHYCCLPTLSDLGEPTLLTVPHSCQIWSSGLKQAASSAKRNGASRYSALYVETLKSEMSYKHPSHGPQTSSFATKEQSDSHELHWAGVLCALHCLTVPNISFRYGSEKRLMESCHRFVGMKQIVWLGFCR
jgi:hypothetical protein